MEIYIVLIISIVILAFLFNVQKFKNGKALYCIIIGFMLLLIMGFRHISLGANDVEDYYVPLFYQIQDLKFDELLDLELNDFLFYLTTKIFTLICSDVHVWIFCLSIPIVCSISYLIYKESKIPSLSFILFLGLNFYGYNFTILRHSVALSLLIIAYLLFTKGNKFLCVIVYAIACGFHLSAVIFILVFILSKTKFTIKQILVVCLVLYISLNMSDELLYYMFQIFANERFSRYEHHVETFNLTMFSINACVYIVSCLNAKRSIQNNDNILILFNISTIALILLSMTTTFALFFRVAMFFGIFNILLLPNTIYYDNNNYRKIFLYVATVIAFSFYFLFFAINNASINPYLFFWE